MKCFKCNYENIEGARFCQNCGSNLELQAAPAPSPAPSVEVPPVYTEPQYQVPTQAPIEALGFNPAGDRFISIFKDPLFLVLCIILSVASLGFSPITVIIAIFSWLCFTAAKRESVNFNHIRAISGAVYADYIVTLVAGWILFGAGILVTILFSIATAIGDVNIDLSNIPYQFRQYFYNIPTAVMGIIGIICGIVFIGIGIGVVIITRIGLKKIHNLVKSSYKSVESGIENYENVGGAAGWIIAYGVMTGINATSSLTSREPNIWTMFVNLCLGAACIIAFMLIKKYFPTENK